MRPAIVQRLYCITSLGLAACTGNCGGNEVRKEDGVPESRRFVDEIGHAPPGCDATTIISRLTALFRAINEGDPQIAARFFGDGEEGPFQWFSFTDRAAGGPGHFDAFTPARMGAFLRSRYMAGDKLVLRGAKFLPYDRVRGAVAFSPVLFEYYVRDLTGDALTLHYGIGKGSYHCPSGRFEGMSLAAGEERKQWESLWRGLGGRSIPAR